MENKELNINEIMCLKQKSEIFYQLEKVGEYLDKELETIKDLQATEENKQEVKKIRANINSTLTQFETRRKEIKQQCLEEYTLFEEKYKTEVKEKLENASEDLKIKIDNIEVEQLREKEIELGNFIEEHIKANHLEDILGNVAQFVRLANLKVNLSTSLKSLKDGALTFIDKVSNEVKLIELEENYSNEILLEYQNNGLDYTKAKLDVITKHKQLEELAKQREQIQEIVKEEEQVQEVVEEIIAPKEIVEEEDVLEVSFKVKGTKSQILQIKNLLVELGVEYE